MATLLSTIVPTPVSDVVALGARPEVGVNAHLTWSSYSDRDRDVVLDKLAQAGVGWIRIDVGWQTLEEAGPGLDSAWYLDRLDRIVDGARRRDLQVLVTFLSTPSGANDGAGPSVPPADPASYADALGRLAAHFDGRVAAWEIWNEANQPAFWNGSVDQYVALLGLAAASVRAASPSSVVVLGGTSYNDDGWIESVYERGGRGSFDVVATHPYPAPADAPPDAAVSDAMWTLDHVKAVRDVMDAHGDSSLPIWFTEFGWSSHDSAGMPAWSRGVSAETQATYLVKTLEIVTATYPYVTHVFWYNDRDRTDADPHNDHFGLLTSDLGMKPAYVALASFLGHLVQMPFGASLASAIRGGSAIPFG